MFCFPFETAGQLNCRLVSPVMDAQVMYGRQVSLHTMGKKIKGEKKKRKEEKRKEIFFTRGKNFIQWVRVRGDDLARASIVTN